QNLRFEDEALLRMIRAYTHEAGLRNLEREIGRVCRKVARAITEGRTDPVVLTADKVREYLGPERFFSEIAERTEEPGVAVGLAWTPNGGDILFIESTRMAGKKGLTLTGHLGEVMKESAQAALSYIRSRADRLGIPPDFFETGTSTSTSRPARSRRTARPRASRWPPRSRRCSPAARCARTSP